MRGWQQRGKLLGPTEFLFFSPLTASRLVQFIGLVKISGLHATLSRNNTRMNSRRGVPPDKRQSSNLIQFVQIFCPSLQSDGGGATQEIWTKFRLFLRTNCEQIASSSSSCATCAGRLSENKEKHFSPHCRNKFFFVVGRRRGKTVQDVMHIYEKISVS